MIVAARTPWWAWAWPLLAWAVLLVTPFARGGLIDAAAGVVLIAAVFAAVYHAEVVAHRTGEPFGTLVLAVNAVLLSCYLFGCHSFRHFVGGCKDKLSSAPLGVATYDCVSCLNRKHMLWAWCSLVSVGFSDLYVRLCSMGVWSDVRII